MRLDTFKGQEKKMLFWEDGDNSTKVKEYMLKHNVKGIAFSKYLGFIGDMITIDESFDFVDEIHIIDSNIKDISFIMNFPNVKYMNIQNDDRTKLDLNNFDKLERVFLTWRKGVVNLFNKKNLKTLKLERFKGKKLSEFEDDMLLEELHFSNSPVEDLSSLGKLKKLKILHLDYLRCLEDSFWLQDLGGLEVLAVGSCKKMSNTILDNISGLINLKKIFFSKMGEIPTLQSIRYLKGIETIGLIEDTKILDGDLSLILELPNLKNINIQGFKHYNPSVNSIRNKQKLINPE